MLSKVRFVKYHRFIDLFSYCFSFQSTLTQGITENGIDLQHPLEIIRYLVGVFIIQSCKAHVYSTHCTIDDFSSKLGEKADDGVNLHRFFADKFYDLTPTGKEHHSCLLYTCNNPCLLGFPYPILLPCAQLAVNTFKLLHSWICSDSPCPTWLLHHWQVYNILHQMPVAENERHFQEIVKSDATFLCYIWLNFSKPLVPG